MKVTNEMVQRAVNYYYRMHQMCMEPDNMHNALDVALRDVEAASTEKANRWDAFSDEELGEINAGASERADKLSLPEDVRSRAVEIKYETERELRRRKGGYQGPGVYLYLDQTETTVLGIVKPDEGEEMVIFEQFVDVGVRGWELLSEFNRNGPRGEWLQPRYRYLRPLGEN